MRSSKESSRFLTVEAVALQNLPQTLRGRERSKRGYASPLLAVALSMFEYYVYSISHGQESACGGRVRPHGLAVSVLNNHV